MANGQTSFIGCDGDGFRAALNPSCDLLPDGLVDLPDGQISDSPVTCLSSPFCKNILVFRMPKSLLYPRRPVPQRGGSRSSRTRGGMRWTHEALLTTAAECGRRNRVGASTR